MEYDKIKELMNDMGNSNLTEMDIDFADGTKIRMKKDLNQAKVISEVTLNQVNTEMPKMQNSNPEKELTGNIVKSPMVGTFYLKPSPTSEPYTEVGKQVKKGDVLCIIEAMKLMNEIESEYTGKVEEILVKDGEPVEYGTPLFRIGE